MGIMLRLATTAITGYVLGAFAQSVWSSVNKRRMYKNSDKVLYVELIAQDGTVITLNQKQWKDLLSDRSFTGTYKTFVEQVEKTAVESEEQTIIQ